MIRPVSKREELLAEALDTLAEKQAKLRALEAKRDWLLWRLRATIALALAMLLLPVLVAVGLVVLIIRAIF